MNTLIQTKSSKELTKLRIAQSKNLKHPAANIAPKSSQVVNPQFKNKTSAELTKLRIEQFKNLKHPAK